jgi:ketosteroid isomerase-like protein
VTDSKNLNTAATVRRFWRLFDRGDFEAAGELLSPQAVVRWPNTREIFTTRDDFIAANRNYPGSWRIAVEQLLAADDQMISVVRVSSPDGHKAVYATSFFRFRNGRISRITEYWGDCGEPPRWRTEGGWARRY